MVRIASTPRAAENRGNPGAASFLNFYDLFSQEFIHRLTGYRKCREVAEELNRFPGAKTVLEVGTAEGFLLRYLARSGRIESAAGYDIRPARIAKARQRARADPLGHRLSFTVGDGQCLPFPDGSFDVALLPHVLEHVPTVEQVAFLIRESLRAARLGVLIALPLRESREPLLRWSKYLDVDHLRGLFRYRNGWIYHAAAVERFFGDMGLRFERSRAHDRVYAIAKPG